MLKIKKGFKKKLKYKLQIRDCVLTRTPEYSDVQTNTYARVKKKDQKSSDTAINQQNRLMTCGSAQPVLQI